jgi:hypothetical protein
MEKRTFWGQLIARLKGETPGFFVKIKWFGGVLTTLATGLTAIPGVPDKITSVTGDLIWVGAVMTLVASFAVKDPIEATYKTPPYAQPNN